MTYRKKQIRFVVKGIILLTTGLMLVHYAFLFFYYQKYIKFLELVFSPDGKISCPVYALLKFQFVFIWFVSVLCIMNNKYFLHSAYQLRQLRIKTYNKIFYLILTWLIISCFFSKMHFLYGEDRFYEYFTFILALTSSIITFILAFRLKSKLQMAAMLVIAIVFLVFGMEEISWGQRMFHWGTPGIFLRINYQQEINLHNTFNPLHPIIYYVFFFAIGIVILLRGYFMKIMAVSPKLKKLLIFYPSIKLYYFGIVFYILGSYMVLKIFFNMQYCDVYELSEECFALFCIAYTANLFIKIKTDKGFINSK